MTVVAVAYVCLGCGKRVEAPTVAQLDELAAAWLSVEYDWVRDHDIALVACSTDCLPRAKTIAKETAKHEFAEGLERMLDAIDHAPLRRISESRHGQARRS